MKEKIKVKRADIDIAKNKSSWDFGNKVLYDLCKNHPNHDCEDKVIAKIWLIGRSHAASIERGRNMSQRQNSDSFYVKTVAPKIKSSDIDKWIANIPENTVLSLDQFKLAITAHWQLTNLFKEIIGNDIEKRSLASKYLHFHRPNAFFIYDSRAAKRITQIDSSKANIEIRCAKADKSYIQFVQRCLSLREYIKNKFGETLEPRQIDNLLLRTSV